MGETHKIHAEGIRIVPGQWRPHCPYEQIAWVSPPWPSPDYVWLDFPEAVFCPVFCDNGLLFLSHVSPRFPQLFPDLPRTPWREVPGGIGFERVLPNGVAFGGSVVRSGDSAAALELCIRNGSVETLREVRLQTCAFLRAIREFSDFTAANKFVHLPVAGWTPFAEAEHACQAGRGQVGSAASTGRPGAESGRFRLGWRAGPAAADLPVMATVSNCETRLVAMTWYDDTYSLVCNPEHPCMHADPAFPDVEPGGEATVRGELVFYEGTLDEFGESFAQSCERRRSS